MITIAVITFVLSILQISYDIFIMFPSDTAKINFRESSGNRPFKLLSKLCDRNHCFVFILQGLLTNLSRCTFSAFLVTFRYKTILVNDLQKLVRDFSNRCSVKVQNSESFLNKKMRLGIIYWHLKANLEVV